MKIITGTHGRINQLLQNIPNDEVVGLISSSEGKISVLVKTNGVIGTPISDDEKVKYEQQCEELEKALGDCKLRSEECLKERDAKIKDLEAQLAPYIKENASLNKQLADEKAKYSKDIEKLKAQVEKLKLAISAE